MPHQEILDDLKILTRKIMKNEGIEDYDIEIKGQTERGDNYSGEIVFFGVTPKTEQKKYNLVMKTTKRSKEIREASGDGVVEARELHMYSKVFPALRKMLTECKSDYQLDNVAKTYLVHTEHGHETIIMDDLRSLGYRLWDKKKPMNSEHLKTVLQNYGKYHASSMALHLKNPDIFKNLAQDMDNIFKHFIDNDALKNLFGGYVKDSVEILKEVGLDIAEELIDISENAMNYLSRDVEEKDRVVITHGDCWINNMMFKYEGPESQEPINVCFLDHQLASFASPATDLSYFLYTACEEQTLTNSFDDLLEIYYESLTSSLKKFDLHPEEVFSYQQLKEHWRKYSFFGLIMASIVIKIQLANGDEAPDLSDFGKNGKDYSALKVEEIEDMDSYRKRIIGVYQHFTKNCLN